MLSWITLALTDTGAHPLDPTRLRAASLAEAANLDSPYSAHLSANSWIEFADGAVELKRLDLPAIRCTAFHQALESDLASASTTASICLVTWSLQSSWILRL